MVLPNMPNMYSIQQWRIQGGFDTLVKLSTLQLDSPFIIIIIHPASVRDANEQKHSCHANITIIILTKIYGSPDMDIVIKVWFSLCNVNNDLTVHMVPTINGHC